jgi:hypothetical protein
MDELGIETKREIVKLVFPELRYGGDPDIERYFELRRTGRLSQALSVYNGPLKARYPEDSSRVLLLKLYREGDPRYPSCQESLVFALAERLALRAKANIDLIVAPLAKADLSDALRALKAVESVLSRLPVEASGALGLLTKYDGFARVLGYREVLVGRALDLIHEYDAVSHADDPREYDFIARSEAIEARRQAGRRAGSRAEELAAAREDSYDFVSRSEELERRRKVARDDGRRYFDPSRIKFSEADKARVEISPALTRREDKVLALCAKYWSLTKDANFERTAFLYSRKYGGKHFEVFRAVKLGRQRGASDDEILSAVAGILTTSYSYSVSGDLYMQVMWRRLRARMEARAIAERLAAPGPEALTRAKPKSTPESRVRARKAEFSAEAEIRAAAREGEVPAPPAGDESPTRISMTESVRQRLAAPPEFALRETTARASARRVEVPRASPPAARRPEPVRRTALPGQPGPARPAETGAPRPAASPAAAPQLPAPCPAPDRRAQIAVPAVLVSPKPPRTASLSFKGGGASGGGISDPSETLRPATKASGRRLLAPTPAAPEPVAVIKAKRGSISDEIRKLSGKSYDVYREIFLEKVRDHIHRALLANQTRSHGLFDTAANEAEDQVFGFVSAHYDDPFMDWESSAERVAVETLGFSMPSLRPVIETCFRSIA